MGGLFHPDSRLVRLMTFITNLVCLNVLWIIGCVPIVTAGASTVAMYSVLFGYLSNKDDAVFKPFWRAFFDNFRQVTPIWLLHIPVTAALGAGLFYMTLGVELWAKVIFGILLFIYAAASSYCYPILARFETTRKAALFNSFALTFGQLLSSASMVITNALPVVLILVAPEVFWKTILAWTLVGFSFIAYLNTKILLPVFGKYEKKQEENQ